MAQKTNTEPVFKGVTHNKKYGYAYAVHYNNKDKSDQVEYCSSKEEAEKK